MALENFDWDRAYLARHNIHHVFEDCVEDLVMQRPATKDAITKCIISRINSVRQSKLHPKRNVFFCVGQQDVVHFTEVLQSVAKERADADATVMVVGPTTDVHKLSQDVVASPFPNIFIVGFPLSITQAVNFEATYGLVKKTLLFLTSTGYETDKDFLPVTAGPARNSFFKEVNPVAQYYRAVGRLAVVLVDSNPKDEIRKHIGAAMASE